MNKRNTILGVLRHFADTDEYHELEDIAEAIEKALRPSFSEQIIENNTVKQRCNLGHLHVTYRLNFRKTHIPALKVLSERPQTTAELASRFSGTLSRSIGKYGSECIHFGVMELAGRRKGQRLYRITELGRKFLEGRARIPSHVWAKDKHLPDECVDGPLISIRDIPDVDHSHKAMHVSTSSPQLQ